MNEGLVNLTCPRCGTERLNASHLRSHWCNGVSKTTGKGTLQPGRMLTSREYVDAITAARLLAESINPKQTLTHE